MSNVQLIVIAAIVALLIFRIYRQTREQRWPVGRMWILPIVFLGLTAAVVAIDTAQDALAPVAAIVGLGIGLAIGMYQGNHTRLRFDKPNKAVYITVTPIGTMIFVAVLVARIGLRTAFGGFSPQSGPGGVPVLPPLEILLGSGLLALAAGTILGLRWYVHRAYDAAR